MHAHSASWILAKEADAQSAVALTLAHPQSSRLADRAPGAHIHLVLPNNFGLIRTRRYLFVAGGIGITR